MIIALYLLYLVPFISIIFFIKQKGNDYKTFAKQLHHVRSRIECVFEIEKERNAFLKKYEQVDNHYLEHVLESKTFLSTETEILKLICIYPTFTLCNAIKTRLDSLTQQGNRLLFTEENRRCQNQIEELEIKQKHPIEVNIEDLKSLLALTESIDIGPYHPPPHSPQLIVRRFNLQKKKLLPKETFLLEMDLIKKRVSK